MGVSSAAAPMSGITKLFVAVVVAITVAPARMLLTVCNNPRLEPPDWAAIVTGRDIAEGLRCLESGEYLDGPAPGGLRRHDARGPLAAVAFRRPFLPCLPPHLAATRPQTPGLLEI